MRVEGQDEIERKINNQTYWVSFIYGNEWSTGDEQEYAWVEIQEVDPPVSDKMILAQLEESALHQASEILNLPY